MVQKFWCRGGAEVVRSGADVQMMSRCADVYWCRDKQVRCSGDSGCQVKRCRGAQRGAEVQRRCCRADVQWLYKGAKEVKRRCRGGAEAVQSRCRDAVAVQRFITGDYAAEGAE